MKSIETDYIDRVQYMNYTAKHEQQLEMRRFNAFAPAHCYNDVRTDTGTLVFALY